MQMQYARRIVLYKKESRVVGGRGVVVVIGVKLWGSGAPFQIVKLRCSAEVTRFPSREHSLVVESHAESKPPNQDSVD